MGNPKGFLNITRREAGYRPVEERLQDYSEVEQLLSEDERKLQASRCMDCGVAFCHWSCPVGNIMPEWQDCIYEGDWQSAYEILQETNNFPEFTGRVCPAPCEASCVLSINDDAVTIRQNELAVIEKAFEMGYVKPNPPKERTGKKVAVVGSGPAGLACADILNQKGHTVTVFEAEDAVGGYLRFGIPDFKLDKDIVDRRVDILKAEGIEFKINAVVGETVSTDSILKDFDAVCLTIGAREARDLHIPGRELKGIYFAMEYLGQQNIIVRGDAIPESEQINAYNKDVIVIGGGDTGSDCVGSANRQGAKKVTQLELMPQPPEKRSEHEPWPLWPKLHKVSSSHEEGCERKWNILTTEFTGENGHVKKLNAKKVVWFQDKSGNYQMSDVANSEFELKADLVLLAMGFTHPEHKGVVTDLGIELTERGNIKVDEKFMTSKEGVFAAGDAQRGASLVVYAVCEGRAAANGIDEYLMKS